MSTHDLYMLPSATDWSVDAAGAARFSWEYDFAADGRRDTLLALYQKGKDKQWDAQKRIDWDLDVDPYDPLGLPDQAMAIYGTRFWDAMDERNRADLRRHFASWQFSQFLHGEQGAMICAARIVESVPDLDASSTPPPRPWTRRGTPSCTPASCRRRSGCSTRSTTSSSRFSATRSATPAGTCPTSRHAGAHRGPGPGRVRPAARHDHQAAAQAAARLRQAGRGPARRVRPDHPA